jgi:restriction endonuclease S subunit
MARAIGQVSISASTMRKMPVPLPSIAEQQRIAAELKEQMASVEKASESAEEELQTINALLVVLLRRAFSGEL